MGNPLKKNWKLDSFCFYKELYFLLWGTGWWPLMHLADNKKEW